MKWSVIAVVSAILLTFLVCYGMIFKANQAQENRFKYSSEIRETTKECLSSVRSNPQVQNFNDDNEIVGTCTKYALGLFNAYN